MRILLPIFFYFILTNCSHKEKIEVKKVELYENLYCKNKRCDLTVSVNSNIEEILYHSKKCGFKLLKNGFYTLKILDIKNQEHVIGLSPVELYYFIFKDKDPQYFEINKQAKLHFDKVIESIESCIDSLGIP